MVIINNNVDTQTIKANRFQENIQNYKYGKDVLSAKLIEFKNDITIEGKSVLILELQ